MSGRLLFQLSRGAARALPPQAFPRRVAPCSACAQQTRRLAVAQQHWRCYAYPSGAPAEGGRDGAAWAFTAPTPLATCVAAELLAGVRAALQGNCSRVGAARESEPTAHVRQGARSPATSSVCTGRWARGRARSGACLPRAPTLRAQCARNLAPPCQRHAAPFPPG